MKLVFKSFIVSLLISNLSFASIATDVQKLGDMAMGSSAGTYFKGKTAEEVLKAYFMEQTGEDVLVNKEIEAMEYGDEVEEGFTSTRSAKLMGGFAEGAYKDYMEGMEDQAEVTKIKAKLYDLSHNWSPLIDRLAKSGARFAYSGSGPGYCGVSFIQLLVVDPKENKIYEVYLSESGTC